MSTLEPGTTEAPVIYNDGARPDRPCVCRCHCLPFSIAYLWIPLRVRDIWAQRHASGHAFEWWAACPLCVAEGIGNRLIGRP